MTRGCGAVERYPAAYGEGDGPLMVMALQQRPTCPPTTSPLQPSTGSRSLGGRQDCSSPLLCGKENRVAGEAGGVGGALWRSLWCSTKVNERSCMNSWRPTRGFCSLALSVFVNVKNSTSSLAPAGNQIGDLSKPAQHRHPVAFISDDLENPSAMLPFKQSHHPQLCS